MNQRQAFTLAQLAYYVGLTVKDCSRTADSIHAVIVEGPRGATLAVTDWQELREFCISELGRDLLPSVDATGRPYPTPGIKSDDWIRAMAAVGMIEPFCEKQVGQGTISYGVSSYGYDIRVANEWQVFSNINQTVIDPKAFDTSMMVPRDDEVLILPPNSFALARSLEYMRIPEEILCVCLGKSTYARCGIICNITPLEPGWEGHITLEISNTAPLPAKIYGGEGLVQVLFFEGTQRCSTSYADRAGKYQGQQGITTAKVLQP